MEARFFDYDPVTGATEIFHYDPLTGRVTLERRMDVEPILDDNQRAYNSVDERGRWGEFTKVASIPMDLYAELRRSGLLQDPKALAKYLNDRDNLKLRTRPGHL